MVFLFFVSDQSFNSFNVIGICIVITCNVLSIRLLDLSRAGPISVLMFFFFLTVFLFKPEFEIQKSVQMYIGVFGTVFAIFAGFTLNRSWQALSEEKSKLNELADSLYKAAKHGMRKDIISEIATCIIVGSGLKGGFTLNKVNERCVSLIERNVNSSNGFELMKRYNQWLSAHYARSQPGEIMMLFASGFLACSIFIFTDSNNKLLSLMVVGFCTITSFVVFRAFEFSRRGILDDIDRSSYFLNILSTNNIPIFVGKIDVLERYSGEYLVDKSVRFGRFENGEIILEESFEYGEVFSIDRRRTIHFAYLTIGLLCIVTLLMFFIS